MNNSDQPSEIRDFFTLESHLTETRRFEAVGYARSLPGDEAP